MPKLLTLENSVTDNPDIELFNIIQRIFNLTQKEGKLFHFLYLHAKEGICITHLAQSLSSERSLIQKLLTQLVRKELVTRKQVSLNEFHDRCIQKHELPSIENKKGYLYLYYPLQGSDLKKRIQVFLDQWSLIIASLVAK